MERKKLLRTIVAALCIVSMVFGYFVEIMPALKAQAAETETLPTDFNEVTPREFGIADFSGNTEKAVYKSSLKPLQSANEMIFQAKVVFGSGTLSLLDKNVSTAAIEGLNFWKNGSSAVRFNCSHAKIHVGGYYDEGGVYQDGQLGIFADGSSPYIYDMYPTLKAGTTAATAEFSLAITTEVVNFNRGTTANDLKVGVWFDGKLYNETYFYLCDYIFAQENILMTATVESITSPAVTAKEEWDGWKIITPATLGIPDAASMEDGITTSTTAKGVEVIPYDLDKTVFQADVVFSQNENSYFDYLYNSSGRGQFRVRVASGANYIYVYNYKLTGDATLYIGGKFENNEYVGTTVAKSASTYIHWQTAELNGAPHNKTRYQLWITTEFVDFDGDGNKDDLQIGLWFDGKLLINDSYFYYLDYEETTLQGRLTSDNMYTIYSPNTEPDDLGLASGEYGASEGTVIGASEVATSKVMSGMTFETDIMFSGVGASLLYGCNEEDTSKAFKLSSTEEGIKVSHAYNGTEEQLGVLTKDLLGVDLVNNKFHLKLTTDVVNIDAGETADDILLGIQVNDKQLGYFAANVATQLTGRTGVECTGDATVTVGSFASDTVEEVQHCLDESDYTISATDGISRFSVNGTVITEDSITLDAPGSYSVVSTKNRLIYKEEVVLYNRYDINASQTVDVKDLVRMLKVANDETQTETIASLSKAGKLAIAYEGADKWTNDNAVHVLDFLREKLVGVGAEAKQTGVAESMNRTELEKFENKHGAFTGNFTFTLDLKDIDRVDENFDDETDEIWILSTKAKYISVDGSYPTIKFKLLNAEGDQLYTSHKYKVGEKNAYVERQWRVPMTLADYTTLQVNFVVPDGVALYIDTIEDLDNVVGEISTEDETVYAGDNGVKYLAHSGFLQYAPDNTALSFRAAGKMGFKSLITIPKFTADGVAVCIHDHEIYKTNLRYTDGTRITSSDPNYSKNIQDFTYEELAQFDAGIYKGAAFSSPIPTLEEYFDICMEYRMAPVFSIHPVLSVEEWTYVKNMLRQDKYKVGDEYWLYERMQIKAGDSSGLKPAFEVFGFEIDGYIMIQTSSWGIENIKDVFNNGMKFAEKAEAAGINVFDKVSVEFFDYSNHATQTVEDKVVSAKAFGFTRISLAPNGYADEVGFSSEKQRHFIDLGVNSFTVDYHCSMGLNW